MAASGGNASLTGTDLFLMVLQDPAAKPVVEKFKSFIKLCKEQLPVNPTERQRVVHRFAERVERVCKGMPLFQKSVASLAQKIGATGGGGSAQVRAVEKATEMLRDGIEKTLCVKLYPQLFEEQIHSKVHEAFQDRLALLNRFIEPRHLDLPSDLFFDGKKLALALAQLSKMHAYKAPKEKMICILNCCKVISSLFKDYAAAHPQAKLPNPPAADEMLSALVILLIHGRPKLLKLTASYVRLYRHPDYLETGEHGYYFTIFESAVDFIDTAKASQFSISPAEFELNMNQPPPLSSLAASRSLSALSISSATAVRTEKLIDIGDTPSASSSRTATATPPLPEGQPAKKKKTRRDKAAAPKKSATVASVAVERVATPALSFFTQLPDLPATELSVDLGHFDPNYRFRHTNFEDLHVSEVGELLADYQRLADEHQRMRDLLRSLGKLDLLLDEHH